MGKLIIIKKSDLLLFNQEANYKSMQSAIEKYATEIDTDQSIEKRCEQTFLNKFGNKISAGESWVVRYALDCATEQDIISKAREGEFAEWIAENDYIRSTNGLWYYKSDGEIEKGITTKELFIKFITEIKNESR